MMSLPSHWSADKRPVEFTDRRRSESQPITIPSSSVDRPSRGPLSLPSWSRSLSESWASTNCSLSMSPVPASAHLRFCRHSHSWQSSDQADCEQHNSSDRVRAEIAATMIQRRFRSIRERRRNLYEHRFCNSRLWKQCFSSSPSRFMPYRDLSSPQHCFVQTHSSRVALLRIAVDDAENVVGGVEIEATTCLAQVRELISEEIDERHLPPDFVFMYQGAPVSTNQERKRSAIHCWPQLQIRAEAPVAVNGHTLKSRSHTERFQLAGPAVSVLFSEPLVFLDEQRNLQALPRISYQHERDILSTAFLSARPGLRTRFRFATSETLRDAISRGSRCLHYSGHATTTSLVLEDGYSGAHLLSTSTLQSLLRATSTSLPLLVFISACSSRVLGNTFVEAGIPHVVAVESDKELRDQVATVFTSAFYETLSQGKTVADAFQIGKEAVKAAPSLSVNEAENFLLLPERGDHNVVILPDALGGDEREREQEFEYTGREGSDIWNGHIIDSVSDPISLPPPPEGFVGRSIDVYKLVSAIRRHRLMCVCGKSGVGLTAVALAAANYVAERHYARHGVAFVNVSSFSTSELVLEELSQQLRINTTKDTGCDIITYLHRRHVLIFLDGFEPEQCELVSLVSKLLQRTRNVSLLLTSQRPLGTRSVQFGVGEKVHWLEPLRPMDAARLFIRRAPRLISPAELGASNNQELLLNLSMHPFLIRLEGLPRRIVEAATGAHKPLQLLLDGYVSTPRPILRALDSTKESSGLSNGIGDEQIDGVIL